MNSENGSVDWVANFRDKFYTFCAEADTIIPQEPIEYVRNQCLTAGESIKQFCTELVDDAKAVLSEDFCFLPKCPKQEKNADSPPRNISSINIDCNQESTSPGASYSPPLLSTEPNFSHMEKGNIGNLVEYKLPCDEVTSSSSTCSTEAIHSFDKDSVRSESESPNELLEVEHVSVSVRENMTSEESRESSVADVSKETAQRDQNLDESLIVVDSGECRSDSVIKPYRLTYQKMLKKFCKKRRSRKSGRQVISAENDAEEWERLDEEDMNDSEWEIV
ncbi:hypothetical protein ABFS82_13G097600 [Erythranthe guttata]|uniref:Uncharacterized protein n=1 Tax=Erythranthe guttata TaxID=4155 RepID=A0A022QLD6_ERYGU|nr:PREDICTED: uncharacterized protein LOC105968527 [Erythranthe guttata]XP_012848615.1 PREDICTED: uncharacterized protein LOC105968527 [Erythranthe guttata]EYU28073.1 hypothetical protein MIMGU_mgv1a011634mg [Erythranthe guttata]|eukprot:XP_012848614.1 PREDICTED: uncharacterized protein LOC105968527 [Erythranthe guttata]